MAPDACSSLSSLGDGGRFLFHNAARKACFSVQKPEASERARSALPRRPIKYSPNTVQMKQKTGAGIRGGHVQIAGRTGVRRHFSSSGGGASGVKGAVWRRAACLLAAPIISSYRAPAGLGRRGQRVLSITLPAVLKVLVTKAHPKRRFRTGATVT